MKNLSVDLNDVESVYNHNSDIRAINEEVNSP
jgi:hypothetical protein